MKKELLEMIKRRKAVDSAIASLELEGFKFTKEEKENFDKYVLGQLTLDDIRNKYIKLAQKYGREG